MSTSIRLPQCIQYNVLRLWLEIFSLSSVRLYMLKYSISGSWEKWLCNHLSVMFGALNVSIFRLLQESRLISHCLEPVCLGVLSELNARFSNRRNQEMFGWARFVGLRFEISRNSRFRKGNFPLRFRCRAICKSRFRQKFLLKTKNSPESSPFTVAAPLSLHHIYPLRLP